MTDPLDVLARHGAGVLFLFVFAEQIGVPVPSAPVIVAAGTLAGTGRMNPGAAVVDILLASLLADSIWYVLGKRYGARILAFLCRMSLVPDSCVRETRDRFSQNGPILILTSKFVPGLNTVTPPLAGTVGIGIARFLALDSIGVVVQATVLLGIGWLLREPFRRFGDWLAGSGGRTALIFLAMVAGYVAWKYVRRRTVLRELRTARITPSELKERIDAGESVVIVDLRHAWEWTADPSTLPGAIRMAIDEIDARRHELPLDREIVLFCT